jgi:thioester reductase-like protein
MNILIIGGTGFIGKRLVHSLSLQGQRLFVLVRSEGLEKAKQTFQDLKDVTFIPGDIEKTDLLTDFNSATEILTQIDCVIHLAAIYELDVSYEDAYMKNVMGTLNVLKFLRRLNHLKYFHFFSTYAVNQLMTGIIKENDLIKENSIFSDYYAKTKNIAEHLVRKRVSKTYQTIIHRPGIIVGNSKTGQRDKDNGPYYFFNIIFNLKKLPLIRNKLRYLPLPVNESSSMPVLPVDILVHWCTQIMMNPNDKDLSVYHLVPRNSISTKEFLEESMKCLNLPLKIICMPRTHLFSSLFGLLGIPKELVFYMRQSALIDRTNLNSDYPHLREPDFKNYLPILIKEYCRTKS